MIEALELTTKIFLVGLAVFVLAYSIKAYFRDGIPQAEIDAEAHELIAEYGDDALSVAEGNALRAQWSKGKSKDNERYRRVLKAVGKLVD